MLAGARTYQQRNKLYGNNYKEFGRALLALFPQGELPTLRTAADVNRFTILSTCLAKLQRYAVNFGAGGHADSLHDLMVYAAMLQQLDRE